METELRVLREIVEKDKKEELCVGSEYFLNDIKRRIQELKSKALNEDEINEIEILDAYYAVASKMYPKVKPVIL